MLSKNRAICHNHRMEEIKDRICIAEKAAEWGIDDFLSASDEVRAYRYERGEIITSPARPSQEIIFIVEGSAAIYGIRADGSSFPLSIIKPPEIIGDLEFTAGASTAFFVEAKEAVTAIALPLGYCKEELWNDSRFLHALLRSLSDKLMRIAFTEGVSETVEDRVISYLRDFSTDGSIKGIEDATYMLRYSRRQLQRVLRKLSDDGIIQKVGKGRYILLDDK